MRMRIQHESSIRGKNRIQLVRVGEPLFGRGGALVLRNRVAKRAAKQRKKIVCSNRSPFMRPVRVTWNDGDSATKRKCFERRTQKLKKAKTRLAHDKRCWERSHGARLPRRQFLQSKPRWKALVKVYSTRDSKYLRIRSQIFSSENSLKCCSKIALWWAENLY